MIQRFFILLVSLLFTSSLFSIPADVEDISYKKYFPAVKKLIREAQSEIYISVYYISMTSGGPVSELLQEIAGAKERGVDVEVVLDFSTVKGKERFEDMKNAKAFSFLRQKGIRVFYDDDKRLNHSKYMIVDKSLVVVGSFNWSRPAFENNHENAVLIRSPEMAQTYLEYFRAIPRVYYAVKDAVPIPRGFIEDPAQAAAFARNSDVRLLDFYLLCQKLSWEQKSAQIIISEALLEEIFFKGKNLSLGDRSIRAYFTGNFLRKAEKKLFFVKSFSDNRKEKVLEVELTAPNTGPAESLWLSPLYWKYRWFERLDNSGKFFIFYLLLKTESLRLGRSFQVSQDRITKEFALHPSTLTLASSDLERFNLIERQNYSRKDDYSPNVYLLNDFYDYAEFEKQLEQIRRSADPAVFEAASKVCDITNEPCDLNALKKLIAAGTEYGPGILQKAVEKASGSGASSSYREFPYLYNVILAWAEETKSAAKAGLGS